MPDTTLDDVNALLLKEKGDKRILEQIKRAAENGEVISIYERNYVAKLRGQYLEKRPEYVPRPVQPSSQPSAQASETPRPVAQKPKFAPPPPVPQKRRHRRIKVIAGVGGIVALLAIMAVGVSMSDIDLGGVGSVTPASTSGNLVSLDQNAYSLGDIISISGKSDASLGDKLVLSIENSDSILVWTEDLSIGSDGEFSTLAIAGGTGWIDSGTYTLTLEHGAETESVDFSFQG